MKRKEKKATGSTSSGGRTQNSPKHQRVSLNKLSVTRGHVNFAVASPHPWLVLAALGITVFGRIAGLLAIGFLLANFASLYGPALITQLFNQLLFVILWG